MNKNIFCSRKGGATIDGTFHPAPRASAILAKQISDYSDKMAWRRKKRALRAAHTHNNMYT